MKALVDYHNALIALETRQKELKEIVSQTDKDKNDFYHILEMVSLSAVDQAKLVKDFKNTLKQRRILKDEFLLISNVLSATKHNDSKDIDRFLENITVRNAEYVQQAKTAFNSFKLRIG